MAIFKIKPADSVLTSVLFADAFFSDTPSADTLIVDPGAFLIATNNGNGAVLSATGAWTVTVNGSVVSQTGSGSGIALGGGNAAVSTIKIGVDGAVQGPVGITLFSPANINNAGTIGTIVGGAGAAILISNGGSNTITNSGVINGGALAIADTGTSNDTLRNSGTINGAIALSGGDDTLKNTGTITGVVSLGTGNNTLTNSGIIGADVNGENGSDTVTNFAIVGGVIKSGIITGTVLLSGGNDKFTGGANSEIVHDGTGADVTSLGGGKDKYIANGASLGENSIDITKGGAGIDTYDASLAVGAVFINLDTVAHDFSPFIPGAGIVAANTAMGTDIAGSAKDTIFGFENANGGVSSDAIYGTAGANVLDGGNGDDVLFGFGGNDTLVGGLGGDTLVGGKGKDQLTGGVGGDRFAYSALSDSGIIAATRDLIADFEPGIDKIDLHLIDADKTNAAGTNDAFQFIGTNTPFTGTAGQLRAFWNAIGQIIEGDVNGDAKPDFSIEIADPTHTITLTSASFSL
jgi:hypothetical protein